MPGVVDDARQHLARMRASPDDERTQLEGCRFLSESTVCFSSLPARELADAVLPAAQQFPHNDELLSAAVVVLRELAYSEQNKKLLEKRGALSVTLSAVRSNANVPLVSNSLRILRLLAFTTVHKRQLAEDGAVDATIAAMRTHPAAAALQAEGCQLLQVLAYDSENQHVIARAGGVPLVLDTVQAHPADADVITFGCGCLYFLPLTEEPLAVRERVADVVLDVMRAHLDAPEALGHCIGVLHTFGGLADLRARLASRGCVEAVVRAIGQLVEYESVLDAAALLETLLGSRDVRNEVARREAAARAAGEAGSDLVGELEAALDAAVGTVGSGGELDASIQQLRGLMAALRADLAALPPPSPAAVARTVTEAAAAATAARMRELEEENERLRGGAAQGGGGGGDGAGDGDGDNDELAIALDTVQAQEEQLETLRAEEIRLRAELEEERWLRAEEGRQVAEWKELIGKQEDMISRLAEELRGARGELRALQDEHAGCVAARERIERDAKLIVESHSASKAQLQDQLRAAEERELETREALRMAQEDARVHEMRVQKQRMVRGRAAAAAAAPAQTPGRGRPVRVTRDTPPPTAAVSPPRQRQPSPSPQQQQQRRRRRPRSVTPAARRSPPPAGPGLRQRSASVERRRTREVAAAAAATPGSAKQLLRPVWADVNPGAAPVVPASRVRSFVQRIELLGPGLVLGDVDLVLNGVLAKHRRAAPRKPQHNTQGVFSAPEARPKKGPQAGTGRSFSYGMFVEAVMAVVEKRYGAQPPDALADLLREHLLLSAPVEGAAPASASAPSPAAPAVGADDSGGPADGSLDDVLAIEAIFDRERRPLEALFQHYAALDSAPGPPDAMTLSAVNACKFAVDFALIPGLLSHHHVTRLFEEVAGVGGSGSGSRISFPQFVMLLGRIALDQFHNGFPTAEKQVLGLLQWMDGSQGKQKILQSRTGVTIRRFNLAPAGVPPPPPPPPAV